MKRARYPLTAVAISILLAAGHDTPAATLLERHVEIAIRSDDSIEESTRLKVRIDDETDAAVWTTYSVFIDDNRELERFTARVLSADGRSTVLSKDDQETIVDSSDSIFYASRRRHVARFNGLVAGNVLEIEHNVLHRPYYRASSVLLRGFEAVDEARITIRANGSARDGWRWRLAGAAEGFVTEEGEGSVTLTASDLPEIEPLEHAPTGDPVLGVLRYGWGSDGTWDDVGRWYEDLAASVPRDVEAVRDASRRMTDGLDDPRRRLDVLTEFVQSKVRYVAVMIGSGNYRPSAPGEVFERRWGDCKDKAVLLIDMLAEAGIEAYPVLIRQDVRSRLDPLFPSPGQFNHAIVAVPAAAVTTAADDPVNGGFLFIDPTQSSGGGSWLHPDDQDQDVLVIRPEGSDLVRTPLLPALEHRQLDVDVAVEPTGDARGEARLEVRGELAYDMLAKLELLDAERRREEARALFLRLLPGAEVDAVELATSQAAVPRLDATAKVFLPGLVQGSGERRSFTLAGMRATPEPKILRDRHLPVVLPARSARTTWHLDLPANGCPPAADESSVDNTVGSFRQTSAFAEGRWTLERRIEVHRRWVESADVPALRELALAEHRAHRRRTRLVCGEPPQG